MKIRLLATCGLAAGLALTAAACSSSPSSSSASSPAASSAASSAGASSGTTTTSDFGPGCASVPKSGAGSFTGMSTAPVATAASANPVLSTLVTAVKKAGLVDTLNSASGITVFAPDNAAFAKLPAATLNSVLADKAELTKILTYHVVAGKIASQDLADMVDKGGGKAMLKTVEGDSLTVMRKGNHGLTLTDDKGDVATITIANVFQSNGVIHVINTVMVP
jgi:uncharacterized surface protein with fasciclin (FAS1) repeats